MEHVARVGEKRIPFIIWLVSLQERDHLKINLREIGWDGVD
jgi:hypothetical protein